MLASYTQELLGLLWRNWLTRRLVGIYLTDRSYVRLQAPGGLPNPDQRISEDIRTFVTMTLSVSLMLIGMPVVFLLLFVYVFGGTLGAGLGVPGGGRTTYVEYVTPGILLMAVAAGATGTAIAVAMDMTEGIVARFRTMAIFRPSVLTGFNDAIRTFTCPRSQNGSSSRSQVTGLPSRSSTSAIE